MSKIATWILLFATCGMLAACSSGPGRLPAQKIGKPYVVSGKTYYPAYDPHYDQTGEASWYGPGFHGEYTASGEVYNQNDLTAAHPTLPMPSLVRVTNLQTGKSLIVRVNDRGPFAKNRLIDLSKKSAQALGIHGTARVRVQFLEQETQDYIAMVQQNGGRIIPMAEYNARAMDRRMARMAPPPSVEEAAPIMTVASQDAIQQSEPPPMQLIRPAAAEEPPPYQPPPTPAMLAAPEPAPMAAAEPEPQPEPTVQFNPNETMTELAPAAAPPVVGAYTIQAGSFASEQNAHKLASKLESYGNVEIEPLDAGGRNLWRVQVGSFIDKAEAAYTLDQIRAGGIPDARVIRK